MNLSIRDLIVPNDRPEIGPRIAAARSLAAGASAASVAVFGDLLEGFAAAEVTAPHPQQVNETTYQPQDNRPQPNTENLREESQARLETPRETTPASEEPAAPASPQAAEKADDPAGGETATTGNATPTNEASQPGTMDTPRANPIAIEASEHAFVGTTNPAHPDIELTAPVAPSVAKPVIASVPAAVEPPALDNQLFSAIANTITESAEGATVLPGQTAKATPSPVAPPFATAESESVILPTAAVGEDGIAALVRTALADSSNPAKSIAPTIIEAVAPSGIAKSFEATAKMQAGDHRPDFAARAAMAAPTVETDAPVPAISAPSIATPRPGKPTATAATDAPSSAKDTPVSKNMLPVHGEALVVTLDEPTVTESPVARAFAGHGILAAQEIDADTAHTPGSASMTTAPAPSSMAGESKGGLATAQAATAGATTHLPDAAIVAPAFTGETTNTSRPAAAQNNGFTPLQGPAAAGNPILGTVTAPKAAAQAHAAPPIPFEDVAVRIARAAATGADHITIKLKPTALGQVDVKMDLAQDGRVVAVITADRADTLDMLARDAKSLERALADAGLKIDSGSLQFNLRGDGGNAFARDEFDVPTQGRLAGIGKNEPVPPVDMTSAIAGYANARAAFGGVDIRV